MVNVLLLSVVTVIGSGRIIMARARRTFQWDKNTFVPNCQNEAPMELVHENSNRSAADGTRG